MLNNSAADFPVCKQVFLMSCDAQANQACTNMTKQQRVEAVSLNNHGYLSENVRFAHPDKTTMQGM